jgi:bacteriorhodopsin
MLYQTAYISLGLQFIIGIIDYLALKIDIPKEKNIYKDLLKAELSVQIVEFIFYIWMIYNFTNIKNITPHRYFDWMVTTPIMLITLMAYLDTNNYSNLQEFIKVNKKIVIQVILLNASMLILGLLGELNYINYNNAITLGFIPFIIYYKLIYNKYINNKNTSVDRKSLFYFFSIIWSLYGIVAYLPYEQKNIAYNILDLFAKNLFGLILVYIIWKNKYTKESYNKNILCIKQYDISNLKI